MDPFNYGVLLQHETSFYFIGRVRVNEGYLAGMIDLNKGIEFLYGGMKMLATENVEYLKKSDEVTYKWLQSSNGSKVENAVLVGGCGSDYISKIDIGSVFSVGGLSRSSGGIHYTNNDSMAAFSSNYDVLVCDKSDSQILSPPLLCRKCKKNLLI